MAQRLSWTRLLSTSRTPRAQASESEVDRTYVNRDERSPFEQDYDRIVFSAPFRRLARKTQVHPMASNDHIHNRLTHSIEVASVGRSFASRVATLATKQSDLSSDAIATLPWVLQSACLIHDLGNPPFGHAGEEVIREWASEHQELLFPERRFKTREELHSCKADWLLFEGNAQGFRVAARSDNPSAGYLRLTYATLGSAVKYPWPSSHPSAIKKRKHNYFSTEVDLFTKVSEELGMNIDGGQWCRHPLSFLTEAADDICYRIIDLEDAVEMGICDYGTVHGLLLRVSKMPSYEWMALSQLRGQAIRSLMDQCWKAFEEDFQAIMNGARLDDLKSSLDSECKEQLKEISELYESIFGHRRKVATELGAYRVLGRILKAFVKTVQSIDNAASYSDVHFLSKRTVELTWGRDHAEANLHRSYSWWLAQVLDYVSGMTDDYATRLSREISGFAAELE